MVTFHILMSLVRDAFEIHVALESSPMAEMDGTLS